MYYIRNSVYRNIMQGRSMYKNDKLKTPGNTSAVILLGIKF